MSRESALNQRMIQLSLGAIGVVYGDLGTSPLYAMKESFAAASALVPSAYDVYGIVSLIFWSIILVISLKYVLIIMRADNNGEGGILALMAMSYRGAPARIRQKILIAGIFGAALFLGDGVITPAISVLSALEGLKLATPILSPYVVPLSIAVLILLFIFQNRGTAKVGRFFGPIMVIWFVVLGILGVINIVLYPSILAAINPYYAAYFLWAHQGEALSVLGSVFLALTGAEALYADMGHFGKKPIRMAWFNMVFPALVLNYFGQGALVLSNPEATQNPFYLMAPSWALFPMIILSTISTVIASQAVISGTFSLGRQAVQLGYLPRLKIFHTSSKEIGQVYIPQLNYGLLAMVVLLVLVFKSSDALAEAYGLAVSGIMVLTSILTAIVARRIWLWGWLRIIIIFSPLLMLDGVFLWGNMLKIPEGGWIPLLIAAGAYFVMSTWKQGREVLLHQAKRSHMPVQQFIRSIQRKKPHRVQGTAIYMSGSDHNLPYSLITNFRHNQVLHERMILLTIQTRDVPYIPKNHRIEIESLGANFYRITASYGFKQNPNVPKIIEHVAQKGLDIKITDVSFFLSRGVPVMSIRSHLNRWRERLFIFLSKNATSATDYFNIPHQRVVELRVQFKV